MEHVLHRPVGALVAEHPHWAGVFERLGIDYCCHGAVPLWEACEAAGVAEASALEALDAAEAAPGSACPSLVGWAPVDIVDHVIEVHHAYLRHHLVHLEDLVDRVHAVHHERHPELTEVRAAFQALHAELDAHLVHEELVVFPACVARSGGTSDVGPTPDLVRQVLVEHDLAAELLARIALATDRYSVPADGCESYRLLLGGLAELEAELHRHVHEENNVLFPAVLAAIEPLP